MLYNSFCKQINVSRETFNLLTQYVELLLRWNKNINLIGKEVDVWNRHIVDSAQLSSFLEPQDKIIDVGSGAGLPGLILSIMGFDVTLIDSDSRKIAFINYIIATLKLNARAICCRIENAPEQQCDVLTSRALAPTKIILNLTRKLQINKKYLLLKGEKVETELDGIKYHASPSITNANAKIIEIHI